MVGFRAARGEPDAGARGDPSSAVNAPVPEPRTPEEARMTRQSQPTRPPIPTESISPRAGGPIRSRPVRRILRLERQAARQALRHDKATARAELFGRRLTALRAEAEAVQASLTFFQRAQLARARAADAAATTPPAPNARDPEG
jgi:hypothetical protein